MVGTYQSWVSGGGGSGDGSGGGGGSGGRLTGPGAASQPRPQGYSDPSQVGGAADWRSQQAMGTAPVGGPPSAPLSAPRSMGSWMTNGIQTQMGGGSQSPAYAPYSTMAGQAMAQAQFGPQQLIAGLSQDQLQSQLGGANAMLSFQQGAMNRNAALDREGLGLQREGVGVDRNLINQQIGLQGEQYANQLRQLGVDEATVRDMAERHIFDLRSNLTSRGAFNTIANERGTGRIERDLGYQIAGIGNQRTGASISNRGALAGLNASLSNLGIKAKQIGLSERQLDNALSDGLAKLGMDSEATINQIQAAIDSGDIGQAQLGQQIIMQAITNSQVFAGMTPAQQQQVMAALGLSPTAAPRPLGTVRDR